MKKWIIAAMIAVLLLSFCGCSSAVPEEEGFADSYIEGDSADEGTPAPEKEEPSAPSQPEKKPAASAPSEKEPAEKDPAEEEPQEEAQPNTPSQNKPVTPAPTPSRPSPTPILPEKDDRLPIIYPYFANNDSCYYGMAKGKNGTIAAIGKVYERDSEYCFVEVYNEDMSVKNTAAFHEYFRLSKIIACNDSGYLLITHAPETVLKLNRNLEREWSVPYDRVLAIREIQPGNYAALTLSKNTNRLELFLLDKSGKKTNTVLLATLSEFYDYINDPAFLCDGKGGFYLISTWSADFVSPLQKIKQAYNSSRGADCLIAHFSVDGTLNQAITVGGPSDEWVEESAMDESGNFYIAFGTKDRQNPLFDTVPNSTSNPLRRLLVKVGGDGKMIYSSPLSGHSWAYDQVFGIELSGDRVFVAGFSGYDDGLQSAFPCSHCTSGLASYVNYIACIDGEGKVYDRRMFGSDVNYQIAGSALLSNGSIVVCGSLTSDNPFKISLPGSTGLARTLFVFPGLAS